MPRTALNRIALNSKWKIRVLFGLLPLVLLLSGALFVGGLRIFEHERARLSIDFQTHIAYLEQQEAFLQQLRMLSHDIKEIPMHRMGKVYALSKVEDWNAKLYAAQESVVDMPFSIVCTPPDRCPEANTRVLALGAYLADFYASFWASSYFPAAAVFFISRTEGVGVSVPELKAVGEGDTVSLDLYRSVTQAAREAFVHHPILEREVGEPAAQVIWLSVPGQPDKMIGMVSAGFPQNLWHSSVSPPSEIFVLTLFSEERLHTLQQRDATGPAYAFSLSHHDYGVLLGNHTVPDVKRDGMSLSTQGLVWKGQDAQGHWTGVYVVPYSNFFVDYKMWLVRAGMAVLLLIFGVVWYARWYKRSVMVPALNAQQQIIESEEFNRTLIQTAPVGLCVLHRSTGAVVFSNSIAEEWLGTKHGEAEGTLQLQQIRTSAHPGMINQVKSADGRTLSVAYAPSVYRDQSVMVCAFTDVTSRMEIEKELARAKQAADDASAAKSLFLSTMSHEIRTPLHGLQGTLELLAMTELKARQRQYVDRMEEASQLLQQLLSDILDMSRIEAGQLSLESKPFNPLELVENCVRSYAAMAQQKGLQIYACVDPEIPAMVLGDAVRLRQILSNLLSNAIKFTQTGKVELMVRVLGRATDKVRMNFEVCDSGVGIAPQHLTQLFQPFFTVEEQRHTILGTGLGLSICQRLAELMGTHMRVRSEVGQGSCFALELELQVDSVSAHDLPKLHGCQLWVRTPYPQLSRNICAWLQRWGAQAQLGEHKEASAGPAESAWLDVLMPCTAPPSGWAGLYVGLDAEDGTSTHQEMDGHSVLSIGRGLELLMQHKASLVPARQERMVLNLRVLVAEDNPINQMTLRDQLEELGCKVTLADDGEDALALWNAEPYDIVFTDVNMLRLNGYQLTKALRTEGVHCPIVGITANVTRDEEQRCLEAGMDLCVMKPIQLHTLALVLHRMRGHSPEVSDSGE